MSSSNDTPSNKIGWYKSMCAKLKNEAKVAEEVEKVRKNPSYKPRLKEGKKIKALFDRLLNGDKKPQQKKLKEVTND